MSTTTRDSACDASPAKGPAAAAAAPTSLADLCSMLHQELGDKGINEMAKIDVERIKSLMESYTSDCNDWTQFSHFDEGRYTRNLVDAGNGKFNLMILCWPANVKSPIHDHAGSHCLMKVLGGDLKESRYAWPGKMGPKALMPASLIPSVTASEPAKKEGAMNLTQETILHLDEVAYIHDKIGLHRISNPTGENSVSLHLYCPPYETCKTFDEKTSVARGSGRIVFFTEHGERKNSSPCTSIMQ
ncbi:Cysteine dioxygenase [Chytriomyces hyalinus]|nr:Cysteine dioxygenase [Chytriomyces hyalinus]